MSHNQNKPVNPSAYVESQKKLLEEQKMEATKETHVLSQTDKKEAHRESTEEERQRIKTEIRNSLSASGPQHVPEHMKDPDYVYAWVILDHKKPFKFRSTLSLGYTHVTHDDMPQYKNHVGDYQGGFSLLDDGGRIGHKWTDSKTEYLMRVPKERYSVIEELREEARQVPMQGLNAKTKKEGFFGEISIGSNNYSTNPPYKH